MRPGLKFLPAFVATCATTLAVPVAGHAQAVVPALATAPAAPVRAVDDGALRYYAQQGQKERVDAELRRLQLRHPGYAAPTDLYSVAAMGGSPEDQPLWDLFGANKLDELKAGIAARQADDPAWQPPADLMLKIRRKELRTKMLALSGDKQWRKLLELARQDPELADTADVELMWSLAEGYAHSKQSSEALRIYSAILAANDKPQERLATLQKSMASLRMADVETLYAMGRKAADGKNEFDVILNDLTRARISAFLHDERKDDLDQAQVSLFADFAKAAPDPNQPGLVAWYHYKRREFTEALDWFKQGLEKGGDAKIAHGLAHSLRQLREFREAEEVAYAWRDYDVANRLLFIDLLEMDLTKEVPPYIEDARLARYGKVVADDASGEGAQALAWYAYNSCQYFTALEWFQRANAWFPKEATAYGLALTYRRLGDRKNFVETVNRYDGLFPKVVALVFPDDHYLPPTPCEESVLAPRPPAPLTFGRGAPSGAIMQKTSAPGADAAALPDPMTDPTTAYPPGTAPNYPGSLHDPLWRYSWGRVPSPTGAPFRPVAPNYHGEPWQAAQFNPNEFPIMVNPQNPLRFLATGLPTASPLPAQSVPPAASLLQAREPLAPSWPLLARKVPGVQPMPYETNGFTLQYANLPDPHRKGVMVQTVRFVAPAQAVAFWSQPQYQQGQPFPQNQASPYIPQPNVPQSYLPPSGPQISGQTTNSIRKKPGAMLPATASPPNYAPISVFAPQLAYAGAQPAVYQPGPAPLMQQAYGAPPVAAEPAAPLRPARKPARPMRKPKPIVASAGGGSCGGGGQTPTAALALGWCLMQSDRPQEAVQAFDRAMAGSGKAREDAAYGKSLANLRTNLTNSAVEAANSAPMSLQHRNEIGIAVLAQQALGFYDKGHYRQTLATLDQRMAFTPETRDLSMMRGWSLYHLGRRDEAERLFQALDQQTSTKESRQGLGALYSSAPGRNR